MQTFVEHQKRDLLIGAFVVLTLVALLSVYFVKSRWWGTGYYTITAEFERISSVKKGVKVRLRGYEIGHVDQVLFNPMPEDDVFFRVVLAIENQYPLCVGTIASIQGGGLVGEKYIDLEVPEQTADLLANGAVIPGSIPDEFGDTLEGAQEMMRSITRMIRRMDDGDVGGKFARFVFLVNRIADSVDRLSVSGTQAFASMGQAFSNMDPGMQKALAQLGENLSHTSALLATVDTVLVENHEQVQVTLQTLNQNLGHLQRLMVNVDSLTTGSRGDVLESIENLKDATGSLKDLAKHPWKFFTGKIE